MTTGITITKDKIIAVSRNLHGAQPDLIQIICKEKPLIQIPLDKITWHPHKTEEFRISLFTDTYIIGGHPHDIATFLRAINFVVLEFS